MRRLQDLEGLYEGAECFLVLNGPSAAEAYPLLEKRGVVTMAVNNGWTQFRPTLWCCHDPGSRFSMHGWRDPAILKFVPKTRLRDAVLDDAGTPCGCVGLLPSVVPFDVRYNFDASKFLDDGVMAGTAGRTTCPDGHRNTVSVMLCALKVLVTLGFKTIYLVGADMGAHPDGRRYAFAERVSANHQDRFHEILRFWLTKLAPILSGGGVRIVNTTMTSNLECFEFCPLQLALESVRWMESKPKTEGRYAMGFTPIKRTPRFQ
jgi:hypothetical protein